MGQAQDALNSVVDAQEQNYDINFKQQLDSYARSALNDATLINRADFDAQVAARTAKGINQRALSRSGVQLNGQAAKRAQALGDIEISKFQTHAKNTAVTNQDQRNTAVLTDSLNAYNDLGSSGMDALKQASGLEANREAGNRNRQAQANAANMGTAASLATAMILF